MKATEPRPGNIRVAAISDRPNRRMALWALAIAVILTLMIRADVSHLNRVASLSMEGSPPPARDASTHTGYTLGQRHFLGTHERGETYRWIAATQDFIADGPSALSTYEADNVPVGRTGLAPRLYVTWLAATSWVLHGVSGETLAPSVEQIALWEPVVTHILALIAAVSYMWIRHGAMSAVVAGLFVALFPPLLCQFLPGVLGPRTWALLLAAYAVAAGLPCGARNRETLAISIRSALAAALALWLDPAIGFPAALISAASGAAVFLRREARLPWLTWSLVGGGATLSAWFVDQGPWSPAAGELRYVHPLYALAWLGLGLALDGWQNVHLGSRHAKWRVVEIAAGVGLVSSLGYVQISEGHRGWLYASAAMRRLTSLDETTVFQGAVHWLYHGSFGEVVIALTPALCAVAVLVLTYLRRSRSDAGSQVPFVAAAIPFVGILAFCAFQIRWSLVASLVALPLVWHLAQHAPIVWKRSLAVVAGAFFVTLLAGAKFLPVSLQRSTDATVPRPADIETLVYRHFSHWLASHHPGQRVSALAPPDLSDSLIFHGGCRVLMSTAWESFPGHVAASRILSAPESSEAEAVLDSREITHVVLPSWDRVLPLLVKAPMEAGKTTLHARIDDWILPPYLRPLPYRMPPAPGYASEMMPVFKVVPSEDEALALSRLAEYFVEMNRPEPARLAAKALAEAFVDDPNAAIARAIVHADARDKGAFARELERLAADTEAGRSPFSWDRRVQRAIVLALGRRNDLARAEIEACLAEATEDAVLELTPLQAFRLGSLAKGYGLTFREVTIAERVAAISSEYSKDKAVTSAR